MVLLVGMVEVNALARVTMAGRFAEVRLRRILVVAAVLTEGWSNHALLVFSKEAHCFCSLSRQKEDIWLEIEPAKILFGRSVQLSAKG